MKLSVIIPVLNGEKYLASQLAALAEQEWEHPWEIIVADNGSKDKTLQILTDFQSTLTNLRIVDASAKTGAPFARNVGVSHARGEFLAFCDNDDVMAPGWISSVGQALNKYDLVTGPLDLEKLNSHLYILSIQKVSTTDFPPFFKTAGANNLGCRRTLYEQLGGFDESLSYVDDADFCIRAQLAGYELTWIPNLVMNYRLRTRLVDIYKQGYNWGKEYTVIKNKYDEPISTSLNRKHYKNFLASLKAFKVLGYLLINLPKVRSREYLVNWLWQYGWWMGDLLGTLQNTSLKRNPF